MAIPALLAKCLTYIPAEYPRLDTEEATLLNYLARMEDLHAAFPRMGRHAAQPYSACDLIPHQKGDMPDEAG